MDDNNYERAKAKAKKLYSTFKPITCPALGGETVHFNSKGFNHLMYCGGNARPREEQVTRFQYLGHAYEIVKTSTFFQEEDKRTGTYKIRVKGKKKEVTRPMEYWGIIAIYDGRKLKVIVRRVGKGEAHFWSVIPNWVTRKSGGKRFMKTHKGNLSED